MTAEEFYKKWSLENYYESNNHSDLISVMKEYAEIKCKELLEIVAEKAKIKVEKKSQYGKYRKWQKVKDDEEFDLFDYEMRNSVDKNSILNAVDLKEFIK